MRFVTTLSLIFTQIVVRRRAPIALEVENREATITKRDIRVDDVS